MEKILFLGIAKSEGRVRATETIHTNKVILEIDCLAVMQGDDLVGVINQKDIVKLGI